MDSRADVCIVESLGGDSRLCCLCHGRIEGRRERQQSRDWQHLGRAHTNCISRVKRGLQVPDRRQWKRARVAAPAASEDPSSTTSPSPDSCRLDPAAVMSKHLRLFGYTFVPATERSRALAHQVAEAREPSLVGEEIAGNVVQADLHQLTGSDQIIPEWASLVKETAELVGVDTSAMFVVDPKLLVAGPGQGQQAVHWDCARDLLAAAKYTCLLVCSAGSFSTALPAFPEDPLLSFSNDPEEMRSVAHLLDPGQYVSARLSPGDVIFFRQSTPHYGVKNTCKVGDRALLFAVLSSSPASMQDAEQVFPWLFVGAAFGRSSKEFAQALVANRMYDPLGRLEQDEGSRVRCAAVNCLRKFHLLESYTRA
jgi:hypothetical protein